MTTTIIIILLVAFALVFTRIKGTKIGGIDDFLDLKWLFPSRRKKITYEDIADLIAQRGVCGNFGQVMPWTNQPCRCTGYKFKKWKRGTEYCECGCGKSGHLYKMPEPKEVDQEAMS